MKSEKVNQLFFLHYFLSGKKIKRRQLNTARECEMCFHQARFKQSLSNPAGLLQQCGLDTAQEVINHGNPEDQANSS